MNSYNKGERTIYLLFSIGHKFCERTNLRWSTLPYTHRFIKQNYIQSILVFKNSFFICHIYEQNYCLLCTAWYIYLHLHTYNTRRCLFPFCYPRIISHFLLDDLIDQFSFPIKTTCCFVIFLLNPFVFSQGHDANNDWKKRI